jgi:pimeloyl-ACP methyl ester carboxylesterase
LIRRHSFLSNHPITLSPHHPFLGQTKENDVATYVLVPGAWLGGWVWQAVAARLRAAGHDVFPVTLTGLGERGHLARPEIDLDTHITDVVNTMAWNDLTNVILAGHSYAGAVVTGVADRVPERITELVYVDSAPVADGMAMIDLYPPETLAEVRRTVDTSGEGWRLPFPGIAALEQDASLRGLDETDRALMEAKATAHPWGTYTQALRLHGDAAPPYQQTVIACDDMRGLVAAGVPQIVAMTAAPWRYLEIDTGHWPMLSEPEQLARLFDGLAAA